jgi:hypothetical protein
MRNVTDFILAITLTLFIGAQGHAQWGNTKVVGNGDITTKTVNTSDYDNVEVVGFMDVELISGAEGAISVTTDDNIHEYLEIETEGNTLKISVKKKTNIRTRKGIKIKVPFTDLKEVSLVGSGDIVSNTPIKGSAVELQLVGSGDMELVLDVNQLDVNLNGSGDMDLKGKAKRLEVKLAGSGDFNGKQLQADDTEAFVAGSGDIEVAAKNSLKARVNGSGSIYYAGKPERTDTKVIGSGSIKSM